MVDDEASFLSRTFCCIDASEDTRVKNLTTPRRRTAEILPSPNIASKSSAFRWSYTLSRSGSEMPS
ncbi:hypothetical protein, partial [Fischerella sp.]|uniref:hypothetical protein n=1 Tax=Fischerella sp. TaxID=1191 RepID=UPI0025BE51FD